MNQVIIFISILGGVNILLVISLLMLVKSFTISLQSLIKALLAKDLGEYTAAITPVKKKEQPKEDIVISDVMTEDEFNKQIERELNGK